MCLTKTNAAVNEKRVERDIATSSNTFRSRMGKLIGFTDHEAIERKTFVERSAEQRVLRGCGFLLGLWGFGTGEGGAKYHIEPSLKFGFLATEPVGDGGLLSLSVTTVLGGYFREGSCTANYGAIGGVQEVNCRMAASVLRPSETLDYLVNTPPSDQVSVSLRYRLEF